MPVSDHSVSPAPSPPPAKRVRLEEEKPQPAESSETGARKAAAAGLDYRNKACLAPMVRSGNLPTRLLSLSYGCDLVWGPEIVDKAMIGSRRVVDEHTGLINYIRTDAPIWWTHPIEKPHLIYQLGSSDPKLAVEAALTVQQDVAGVDLNCGCPKPFSTHSGMGAALLSTPDLLCSILRALVAALDVPVSCKIRLLPDQAETLALVEQICQTGIQCLTIHARTRSMRSTERALMERLRDCVDVATKYGIPVVANGDVGGMWDFAKVKAITGVSSIMIARAAESNPSCFLPDKPLDTTTVIVPRLIKIARYFKNPWGNTRFLHSQFSPSPEPIRVLPKAECKQLFSRGSQTKSIEALAEVYGVDLGDEEARMNDDGEDVLGPVREGIERRKKERESGVWALGGEQEKKEHEARGEVVATAPSLAQVPAPAAAAVVEQPSGDKVTNVAASVNGGAAAPVVDEEEEMMNENGAGLQSTTATAISA